jgi:outer membrane protein OmpA-like peptidoglycan-associated protein/plastocyanin
MKPFRPGLIPFAIVVATLSAPAAWADDSDFDDRFYIAPMFSYVMADDARETDDGYGGLLAIGKRIFPRLDLEARVQYLKYEADEADRGLLGSVLCGILPCPEPEDVDITSGGVALNYFLSSSGTGFYLHGDAMMGDSTLYNAGVGYEFGSDGALRLEALYHNDDGEYDEVQFNVGFRIPFGKRSIATPFVEPVAVVPVEETYVAPPPPPPPCEMPAPGQPMTLDGCKAGDTLVLRGVNFDFDKATLTVNAKTLLDMVADALVARSDVKVEIAGHTDAKGSDAYNLRLSDRRAASVKEYLVSKGIADDRMTTMGYGESVPVADNASDEGRELNRRVELKVTEAQSSGLSFAPAAPVVTVAEPAAEPAPAPAPEPVAAPTPAAPPVVLAPAPLPPPSADAGVAISNFMFVPDTLTVAPGTTVTWTNNDRSRHTIVFPEGEIAIASGQSYSRSYDQPGDYTYVCGLHPSMTGKIIVK